MIKTLLSDAGAAGSIPGEGIPIPDASWPKQQNVNRSNVVIKFKKDFKTVRVKIEKSSKSRNHALTQLV